MADIIPIASHHDERVATLIRKALDDAISAIKKDGVSDYEIAFCLLNEGVSLLGNRHQLSSELRSEAIKIVNDCVDCDFGFTDMELDQTA